jgi:hypothetical protein
VKENQLTLTGYAWEVEWNAQPLLNGGDGDWVVDLIPEPDKLHYATNSLGDVNFQGSDGRTGDPPERTIQCEIQPRENRKEMFDLLMADLLQQRLTIVGPFVEDTKHCGPNGGGRTEIHPILSILLRYADDDLTRLRVKFLAFSDASTLSPVGIGKTDYPPNAHSDCFATFSLDWPSSPSPEAVTHLQVAYLCDPAWAASADVQQVGTSEQPTLSVAVHTGTPDEGKGMYGAVFTMIWKPSTTAVGNSIRFRTSGNFYLSADHGKGDILVADRTGAAQWETFEVEFVSANRVTIQADSGLFVSADGGGGSSAHANKAVAGASEIFTVEGMSSPPQDGEVVHLYAENGQYVSAENGGGGVVDVNRDKAEAWESFTIEVAAPSRQGGMPL